MTKKESIEKCLNCALPKCTGNCTAVSVGMGRPEARKFPFRGEELTMRQISERTGVGLNALYQRITVLGWDVEKAVSVPVGRRSEARELEAFGKHHSLEEWAAIRGIPLSVVKSRLYNGWDPERALTEPAHRWAKLTVNGRPVTRGALAELCGVSAHTISCRAGEGWTGDRIAAFYMAKRGVEKPENP